jgi:hypothetical protein
MVKINQRENNNIESIIDDYLHFKIYFISQHPSTTLKL